jgi:hypothetical protein
MADKTWREGFRELKRGLTFDSWTYHPQLAEVGDRGGLPDTRSSSTMWRSAGLCSYASHTTRSSPPEKSMRELARRPTSA